MAVELVSIGVCCADVMVRPVDALPERGQLGLVDSLTLQLGGLAGVTAITYAQLGGTAALIAGAGYDGFGDFLVQTLESFGVDTGAMVRTAANTSATVVLIGGDGERTFLHQVGATGDVTEESIDFGFIQQAKAFHWGGPSVTPALDGAPMGRVMEKVRSMGVKTSMDTCYDGTGKWLGHIEAALPHLDLVMSSIEEARNYTGEETPEAIAEFYRAYGPETVMIKLGGDGLFVTGGRESHRLPAHPVEVVDTTGAGDAACGGFLYGWLRGWDLLECARLANAVGALTVQRVGGAGAVRSLNEAMALLEAR